MMLWLLLFNVTFASAPLQELKKSDLSILLREPTMIKEDRNARCFLLPAVNEGLSRVQQRMRVLQAGMRVTRCYEPGDARYGKGAVVEVEMTGSGQVSHKQFTAWMRKEGFREAHKKKGIFVHEASEESKIFKTPVAELP